MTQFVVIDVETGEQMEGPYDNGSMAAARAHELTRVKSRKYRVVKIAVISEDKPVWHAREQRLFDTGIYKRLPWHDAPWNTLPHFAHVSRKSPNKLAFTKNDEHGERDIQTLMRPGRYLTQYFPALSQDDIRDWCGKYAAENEELELKFATTPDEIEDVYTHGPRSCMSYPARDFDSNVHPTRVYGAGDLAIAYIEDADNESDGDGDNARVTARAICWPAKKIYGRMYGDISRLCELLEMEGFSQQTHKNSFEGARLLRIENDNDFVAPYLDHIGTVHDNGKFLILSEDDEYNCQETNGLCQTRHCCDHCNKPTNETYTVDGEQWCEYCRDNDAFYCDGCCETIEGSAFIQDHRGRDLCESCAENYTCCTTCEEYFNYGMRDDMHGNYHCEECAKRLEKTYCGQLADDINACDCRECDQWREDHADLFGEPRGQDGSLRETASGLVLLKPTSPKVEDYRQTTLYVVRDRSNGFPERLSIALSLSPYRV